MGTKEVIESREGREQQAHTFLEHAKGYCLRQANYLGDRIKEMIDWENLPAYTEIDVNYVKEYNLFSRSALQISNLMSELDKKL